MTEYRYEKILRDSRIFTIWEGANEVLRLFIGLSGCQAPGEQLQELGRVLKAPLQDVVESLGVLGDYGVRWLSRKVGPAERLSGVHPVLAQEARVVEDYVARLADATEVCLRLEGKRIMKNQWAVKRLADVAIDLYALCCTLSRASLALSRTKPVLATHDVAIARMFCRHARRRMAHNLRRLHRNEDELEVRISDHLYEVGLPEHALFQ